MMSSVPCVLLVGGGGGGGEWACKCVCVCERVQVVQ